MPATALLTTAETNCVAVFNEWIVEASESKNPHDDGAMGIRISWGEVLLAGQRRYFSEKARSRLRGSRACLMTAAPKFPVRAAGERVGVFLLAHCQVGFAVMFIIVGISFSASE